MNRAFFKFYFDSTRYNIAFSVLVLLIVNPLAGIISLPTYGLAIGLLCYRQFHGNQYYFYYNLGFSKQKLILNSMIINSIIAILFLLIIYYMSELIINKISKKFQKRIVLSDISIRIKTGEILGIFGRNGSGKSTLMNILGLLDIPTSGSYLLNDTQVANLTEDELAIIRRGEIGFIFQQFNLLPRLEAWQNVALPLIYSEGKFNFEKAKELLELVNLGDRLYHKTNEVSGGQMQRIAIARSLINSPNSANASSSISVSTRSISAFISSSVLPRKCFS